jgi:hypothetical protein
MERNAVKTRVTVELPSDLVMELNAYLQSTGLDLNDLVEQLLMQALRLGRCQRYGILCHAYSPACPAFRVKEV